MKLRIYKCFLAITLLACVAGSACATDAGGARVVLHTSGGDVPVKVEIADTPERRSLGLMYRKELGADAGMLFIFDAADHLTFWMKNTPLPLDMIFIGDDKRIVGIAKDAVPYTTTPRGVEGRSRYVLEVNAGYSERHGVRAGDAVTFEGVGASGAR
jgi:uncharacterized membrane protein (UPF0127 family)